MPLSSTGIGGRPQRGTKRHSYYLPLETYLKKGSVNFISPYSKGTKFKDSSLAFFDLDEKEAILYDLKKWFKKPHSPSLGRARGPLSSTDTEKSANQSSGTLNAVNQSSTKKIS